MKNGIYNLLLTWTTLYKSVTIVECFHLPVPSPLSRTNIKAAPCAKTTRSLSRIPSSNDDDHESFVPMDNCTHRSHQSRRQILTATIKTASTSAAALMTISSSTSILLSMLMFPPTEANAAQTGAEAIRRSASKLPGYGVPDIYYPQSFVGKWKAERVSLSIDDTVNSFLSSPQIKQLLPLTLTYEVRFITVDDDDTTVDGSLGKVVADRQFNEISYYNALRSAIMKKVSLDMLDASNSKQESSLIEQLLPSIRSATWSPFNPNVLSISYADASGMEVKVTKRASDMNDQERIVSSSEFRRITAIPATNGAAGGIPSISASRMLTKWRSSDDNVLEGIELVYSDGIVGDPMSGRGMGMEASQGPRLVSKSRLRLERLSGGDIGVTNRESNK